MREVLAVFALFATVAAAFYDFGARSCPQAGSSELASIDLVLGLLWRFVPLVAVVGLLVYIGGLLWLDYVRRSWAAHPDTMRGPLP